MFFNRDGALCSSSPNPNRFLGHNQNECLLSVRLHVCIGIYEAYPQVTCYNYKFALFLAH